MAAEVSTVARTRNENDTVPNGRTLCSRVKERARTARAKTVRARTVKGRRKAWMARTRVSPSRRVRRKKDKKCFCYEKIGHVKADCRKKKRDDEERKTTLAQNSLILHPMQRSAGSTSGASALSLRQLTVPSHVSDDEFHNPMRIFAVNAVARRQGHG